MISQIETANRAALPTQQILGHVRTDIPSVRKLVAYKDPTAQRPLDVRKTIEPRGIA